MTMDDVFGWAVAGSVGAHAVGLALAAAAGVMATSHAAAPPPVPIEVVRVPSPEPPPPERPRPEPLKKPKAPTPRPLTAQPKTPAPIQPSQLIDEKVAADTPAPAGPAPQTFLPPNAVTSRSLAGSAGEREGGPAGAGELFSTGDIPVKPGPSTGGGSGAGGRAGTGLAKAGDAEPVGSAGVTSFAKPLGGYQTMPTYPESARRAGIQGVATLRFVVNADGHVGTVVVDRSAGSADLDQAAVEAVKSWRFEPARRGKEPVPVWVTLPVRFSLTTR